MKVWKKCNRNRYELYIDDPEKRAEMAVLYVNDGKLDFSSTYLGNHHSPVESQSIEAAQLEIEQKIISEATRRANMHLEIIDLINGAVAQ